MDDRELIAYLRRFGIDEASFRVLPLLPLCHVAWADGEVQAAERVLILDLANRQFDLGEEGRRVLENWLTYAPTYDYLARGHDLLVELAKRRGRVSLDARTLADVIALAQDVAAAAGGLWGFRKVAPAEREALGSIADALHLRGDAGWSDVLAIDEEEPSTDATVAFHPEAEARATVGYVARVDTPDDHCHVPVDGLTIGRGRDNTVQIMESPRVSRQHCRLFQEPASGRFYVRDLGSTTGTRVNGERIVERRLFGEETLDIGGVELRFGLLD